MSTTANKKWTMDDGKTRAAIEAALRDAPQVEHVAQVTVAAGISQFTQVREVFYQHRPPLKVGDKLYAAPSAPTAVEPDELTDEQTMLLVGLVNDNRITPQESTAVYFALACLGLAGRASKGTP